MENIIWLNDHLNPSLSEQFTGTFQASTDWEDCTLELSLSSAGVLSGAFQVGEQTLEVKGGVGKSGVVFGFLLEPVASVPVALFRIKYSQENFRLELDVPEFDSLLDYCSPEPVNFERVDLTKAISVTKAIRQAHMNPVDINQAQTEVLVTEGVQ
jgi:hypothetical protein